jgi:hypothetical protein
MNKGSIVRLRTGHKSLLEDSGISVCVRTGSSGLHSAACTPGLKTRPACCLVEAGASAPANTAAAATRIL